MKECRYCQTECKPLGLSMHERYCKHNPDKLSKGFGGARKGTSPWNKGSTLSNEHKESIKNALIGKSTGKANSKEAEELRKQKISSTMKSNPKAGGLRVGSGRGIKIWYDSPIAGLVYLRSSYEIKYAKWLDDNNIKWIGNKEAFEYVYEGITRKYYPDFYLIDENTYIEIKGFRTQKDLAKWESFPHKLKILYGKDLDNL